MAYATLAKFRTISHFSVSEISDADVESLIPEADRAVMRMATIEVVDERLRGDINGSNTLFTTAHKPMADIDASMNSVVDKDDVVVYLVDYDTENNPVHTDVSANLVNARDGIITLLVAPTTTNAEVGVYADYRYYPKKIDYDILSLAACYYLAHLAELKVRGKKEAEYVLQDPTIRRPLVTLPDRTRWFAMVEQLLGLTGSAPRFRVVK